MLYSEAFADALDENLSLTSWRETNWRSSSYLTSGVFTADSLTKTFPAALKKLIITHPSLNFLNKVDGNQLEIDLTRK